MLVSVDDPELILLKGHLLIEEQLNSLIECYLEKPENIEKVRLTFAQKVRLLACMDAHFAGEKVFLDLNKIRNKLAHNADFQTVHDDLREWACSVIQHWPKTIRRKEMYRKTLVRAFLTVIGYYKGKATQKRRSRQEN